MNMKTKHIIVYLCLFAAASFISCSEDEGAPTRLNVSTDEIFLDVDGLNIDGQKATFTIDASFAWKAVCATWIDISAVTGTYGETEITISVGNTSEDRSGYITITAADQRRVITVHQSNKEASPSILTVSEPSFTVEYDGKLQNGNDPSFTLSSNKKWSISGLPMWISANPSSGDAGDNIVVTLDVKPYYYLTDRIATLSVSAGSRQESIEVSQLKKSGTPLFYEDFSWLTYGSTETYTTTGETAYNSWTTEEKGRGWTSTPVEDTGGTLGAWLYARPGFVKLGKTNVGGDLISPKLSSIAGTKTIVVSFKAICYVSASAGETAGSYDFNELNMEVLGAGAISRIVEYGSDPAPLYRGMSGSSESGLSATGAQFWIGAYPSNQTGWPNPAGYNIWDPDYVTRTVEITGATADTQIRWIGGSKIGDLRTPDARTNRIFLDEIIVVEE